MQQLCIKLWMMWMYYTLICVLYASVLCTSLTTTTTIPFSCIMILSHHWNFILPYAKQTVNFLHIFSLIYGNQAKETATRIQNNMLTVMKLKCKTFFNQKKTFKSKPSLTHICHFYCKHTAWMGMEVYRGSSLVSRFDSIIRHI